MRILICDDIEVLRKAVKLALEKAGHEVVAECSDGLEAYNKYVETRPDVCILDIAMAGMDGIAALKKICAFDPNAKAIMCTGRDDQISMIDSLQNGAIDFIGKPFTPARLFEALDKVK